MGRANEKIPMFFKTNRVCLIFLRRAWSFRRFRITTGTPSPVFRSLHNNLRRNPFLFL